MKNKTSNFIENIIEEDIKKGFPKEKLKFRFPPEPNGYLHIGHVKAIVLNFELAKKYNAPIHLRFDDTNPTTENRHFIEEIKRNIKWLKYSWTKECYASDYFDQLYEWAHCLIDKGVAYIDSQSSEKIAQEKGTPTIPGKNSMYRDRSIEENKYIFSQMREGKYKEGEHVLRAKISMSAQNMLLRDPVFYRISYTSHVRTNKNWCLYPLYDWAHGQSDYIEQISHSLCTLEFKPHRDLYNWFLKQLPEDSTKIKPKQREFSRLNLSYTITSKRKLSEVISNHYVSGWDDPRMPTISGMERRGYTPAALRNFVNDVGISKRENTIDIALLEFSVRKDLNKKAQRIMGVLDPIRLTITNYPEDKEEILNAENNPENKEEGERKIPFNKNLYIESDDFIEQPQEGLYKLSIGEAVRLKHAYIITANAIKKDNQGNIIEIEALYDPKTKSGQKTEENKRKVKATIHWVTQKYSKQVTINLYDRLFYKENPEEDKRESFLNSYNKESLVKATAFIENGEILKVYSQHKKYQFQRKGYFVLDKESDAKDQIIFNKVVDLKETWKNKR